MLIWGSTIPTVYYGFYCDPTIQKIYWTLVRRCPLEQPTISSNRRQISFLATACAITTLHPNACHPSLRPYRAAMYSCLGLSSIIFIIHGIMLYGYKTQKYRMSLDWMGIMATLNLLGAFAYTVRVGYSSWIHRRWQSWWMQIPEKWFPRRHDILGSSHQILHFMVIFAGLAHMAGLLRAFDHIHTGKSHCSWVRMTILCAIQWRTCAGWAKISANTCSTIQNAIWWTLKRRRRLHDYLA